MGVEQEIEQEDDSMTRLAMRTYRKRSLRIVSACADEFSQSSFSVTTCRISLTYKAADNGGRRKALQRNLGRTFGLGSTGSIADVVYLVAPSLHVLSFLPLHTQVTPPSLARLFDLFSEARRCRASVETQEQMKERRASSPVIFGCVICPSKFV
jgi:hypothetical protein